MGRFFGPTPNIISGDGFFRGSGGGGTTFMAVAASTPANPANANVPYASWRDTAGVWHNIDTTALGARGLFGVTHRNGNWYATTNAPGGLLSLIGVSADGAAAFSAVATGLSDPLADILFNGGQFVIASLFSNIITAPPSLASFTSQPSHGPGSYQVCGLASNAAASAYVCVGLGSAPTALCQSPDAATWTQQSVSFFTQGDLVATTAQVLWDGTQFVAACHNQVITSPDGLTWSTGTVNLGNVNCVTFDAVNHLYYVGKTNGSVAVSPTIAGLATAVENQLNSGVQMRAAASANGITLIGDNLADVWVTTDGGLTWNPEDPGFPGSDDYPITGLSANL